MIEEHRFDLGCEWRSKGFLYNVAAVPKPVEKDRILVDRKPVPVRKPMPPRPLPPKFLESESVQLQVEPAEVTAGEETVVYQALGLKAAAIDMMYTVDDREMPTIRRWRLG